MKVMAAVVQLNARPVLEENLKQAESLIRAAAKDGATLISTPENSCRMRATPEGRLATSFAERDHPAIPFYANLARELGVFIVAGSFSSIRVEEKRMANRSFLFGKDGTVIATYDKIHMFDVDLPNGDRYRESDSIRPGDHTTVAQAGDVRIGMTVCYDLRFPHLYRKLAKEGAEILTIPAAFTVPTGQAHWEVLLRARAIENGCFVLAAAQAGLHEGGRATYGHSLIVAPWGEILAEVQGDKPGYAVAGLDMDEVVRARGAVPSLSHDRPLTN